MTKAVLDHMERKLDTRTQLRFEVLSLLGQLLQRPLVQGLELAAIHGDAPGHLAALELLALVRARVAGVGVDFL